MGFHSFQPLPDIGINASLHECDRPVVNIAIQEVDLLSTFGPDKIIGNGFVVVEEIVLNRVAAMTETENKVLLAKMRVILHQVPDDRTTPNLHHRFRPIFLIPAEPHSDAT